VECDTTSEVKRMGQVVVEKSQCLGSNIQCCEDYKIYSVVRTTKIQVRITRTLKARTGTNMMTNF
jgi:hypothetical protein